MEDPVSEKISGFLLRNILPLFITFSLLFTAHSFFNNAGLLTALPRTLPHIEVFLEDMGHIFKSLFRLFPVVRR